MIKKSKYKRYIKSYSISRSHPISYSKSGLWSYKRSILGLVSYSGLYSWLRSKSGLGGSTGSKSYR